MPNETPPNPLGNACEMDGRPGVYIIFATRKSDGKNLVSNTIRDKRKAISCANEFDGPAEVRGMPAVCYDDVGPGPWNFWDYPTFRVCSSRIHHNGKN